MLTTPSPTKSDPRVMCGLIANTSLKLIDKRPEDSSSRVFESTLLRLLDIYQYDAFQHRTRRAILARAGADRTDFRNEPDHESAVRDAIAAAHKAMFPKHDRAQFCELIAADVRACFNDGSSRGRQLAKHKAQLRRFLTLVRDHLSK